MTSTCLCFQIEQSGKKVFVLIIRNNWAAPSEFGIYRLCERRRFRRACASAQSRQNLRCSLIHALSQEEPSDRKLDPWPLWMVGHAQLKFVVTECSKISDVQTRGIIPCCQRTTKAPIRLRGCAGWSAPLLFAYGIRHLFSWPGSNNFTNFGHRQFRLLIMTGT